MGIFKNLLIFLVGFAVAWMIIRFFAVQWRDAGKKNGKILNQVQDDDIIHQQAEVKEDNLQKIIEALKNQEQITNNEVQTLLGVSDATATRYFDELEKQGIVEQIGATGAGVLYRKK